MHCIALHCIALHCIALHCIALHCIVLYCIVLYCIVQSVVQKDLITKPCSLIFRNPLIDCNIIGEGRPTQPALFGHSGARFSLCYKQRIEPVSHSQNKLQNAVNDIQMWATDNNMSLNASKTKELLVYYGREELDIPRITINGDVIERVTCAKLLGCHIMSNLSWEDHIANLVSKASRRLHLLRELTRAGLSTKDLLTCYFSIVRSTTEYACQVWSTSLTNEQSHAVETIQRRAMQIISPHKKYEEALHENRLVTLQQRRNDLCNRLFKDIQNSSHRLNSLLPRQHNPGYQLRHSKKYPLPLVKTNIFKSCFINWCLYNSLPVIM